MENNNILRMLSDYAGKALDMQREILSFYCYNKTGEIEKQNAHLKNISSLSIDLQNDLSEIRRIGKKMLNNGQIIKNYFF